MKCVAVSSITTLGSLLLCNLASGQSQEQKSFWTKDDQGAENVGYNLNLRTRLPFNVDGQLTLNGATSSSYTLPAYSGSSTSATTQAFDFSTTVPAGAIVTCEMTTCTLGSGTSRVGLRVGEGTDLTFAFDNGDTNLAVSNKSSIVSIQSIRAILCMMNDQQQGYAQAA